MTENSLPLTLPCAVTPEDTLTVEGYPPGRLALEMQRHSAGVIVRNILTPADAAHLALTLSTWAKENGQQLFILTPEDVRTVSAEGGADRATTFTITTMKPVTFNNLPDLGTVTATQERDKLQAEVRALTRERDELHAAFKRERNRVADFRDRLSNAQETNANQALLISNAEGRAHVAEKREEELRRDYDLRGQLLTQARKERDTAQNECRAAQERAQNAARRAKAAEDALDSVRTYIKELETAARTTYTPKHGDIITPADGHEHISADSPAGTFIASEAVYHDGGGWYGAWRTTNGRPRPRVLQDVNTEALRPGTWTRNNT